MSLSQPPAASDFYREDFAAALVAGRSSSSIRAPARRTRRLGASNRAERAGQQNRSCPVDHHAVRPPQSTSEIPHHDVLADRLVKNDFAARHGDDAIARLEHVMQVVADEYSGDSLRLVDRARSRAPWSVSLTERWLVGSSRISTLDLKCMARAMATPCRWPPESSLKQRVGRAHMQIDIGNRLHRISRACAGDQATHSRRSRSLSGSRPMNRLRAIDMVGTMELSW